MRIKFYKRPPPIPPKFYYRSGEVTTVIKMTPKTWKSADQRNYLTPAELSTTLTVSLSNLPQTVLLCDINQIYIKRGIHLVQYKSM